MTEIAIVQENDEEAKQLCSVLDEYASQRGMAFSFARFKSGSAFLAQKRAFRLVFLDTDVMSDGVGLAQRYRLAGGNAAIVFVSKDGSHAAQSYEVDALDYLIKPVTLERLSLRLSRAFDGRGDAAMLIIRDRLGPVRISADAVIYIEIHGHVLTWHTEQGNFSENGSMRQLKETLTPLGFASCNACYLVNLRYALRVKGYFLTLTTGEVLKISQPKRKDFIAALRG